MKRRLSLHKETLAPLGSTDLRAIAGGTHLCTVTHATACQPTAICPTLDGCASLEVACPTVPVLDCLRNTTLCVQTS